MIRDVFTYIEGSSKAADKKNAVLGSDIELLSQIFDDTYNDSKYNIKLKEDEQIPANMFSIKTLDENYQDFHEVLTKLASLEVTGNKAKALVVNTLSEFYEGDRKWLIRILNKNLKIGVSGDKFFEWIGQPKDKFEVTLAVNIDKVKNIDVLNGNWYASSKLDGCRCVAIIDADLEEPEVKFYSRQGKEFKTLNRVKAQLARVFKGNISGKWVLDGEICIVDDDGNEDFQSIMKEITRKDHTIDEPKYILFDIVQLDKFNDPSSKSQDFNVRYDALKAIFHAQEVQDERFCLTPYKTITVLRQELITSQNDFDRWAGYVEQGNWEGFMLRKNIPYEKGRTKNLLKVKKFFDAEYVVEDVEVGTFTTAEPGKGNVTMTGIKSLIIKHKDNTVNVGSGLSKEQRLDWLADPSKIIGKTITVKYFEETQNQDGTYSLRFPTLKHVYENGREC